MKKNRLSPVRKFPAKRYQDRIAEIGDLSRGGGKIFRGTVMIQRDWLGGGIVGGPRSKEDGNVKSPLRRWGPRVENEKRRSGERL